MTRGQSFTRERSKRCGTSVCCVTRSSAPRVPRFGGFARRHLSAAKRALAAMRFTIDGGSLSLARSFNEASSNSR